MNLVPLDELAKELGVNRTTVYRLARRHNLPTYKRLGDRRTWIDRDAVAPYAEFQPKEPAAEPTLNDYEQLVRAEWMTRDEVEQAFKSLAPSIAQQALVFLDEVLSAPAAKPDKKVTRHRAPTGRERS